MSARRTFLARTAAAVVLLRGGAAGATPAELRAAMQALIGERPVARGRVRIELPPLIDNGNAVPLGVSVENPPTGAARVKAIHVVAERNPQPYVISMYFGPGAGTPRFSTRVRLAASQQVVALAEFADDSVWSDTVSVVVTLSACLEEGLI